MRPLRLLFGAIALAALLALPAQAAPGDPATVAAAFEARYNAGDVNGLLALLSDSVVIRTEPALPGVPATISGKTQVRSYAIEQAALHGHDDITSAFRTDGDVVSWGVSGSNDYFRQLGIGALSGTGQAVVLDGQIVTLTYHFPGTEIARLQAALAARGAGATAQLPRAMPRTGEGGSATSTGRRDAPSDRCHWARR
jgi:hypothetical protein